MSRITDVAVRLSPTGRRAVLDPYPSDPGRSLQANTVYRAVVTTGARDVSDNGLDQKPATPGAQQKSWRFTTGAV